ncbi:MAG: aminoglycoside phosphotransferase family protein [Bacteroidetes bacterium]|nr:aminoglycoside phosphotransferase family protein [Bacteroidota bacterium]
MAPDLITIAERFRLNGTIRNVFPYGSGHINDTFKVLTSEKNYLLQRVNQEVFKDVRGLTSNLVRVTDFLSDKIAEAQSSMEVMMPIRTVNGTYFYMDDESEFWRVFTFIEGSKTYDRALNVKIAEAGGHAFGWFLKMLSDFPVDTLMETIPNFHDAVFRLNNLKRAIENDKAGRVKAAQNDIAFALDREAEMMAIYQAGQEGSIPVRVTHNDTKINNVLFDENDKARCVIDLDTVMPGYVLYDFGDAIRTYANTGDEDDPDPDHISMNPDLFRAFAEGYLGETKEVLTQSEIDLMAFSARYITWEQTIRFLTDYLNGDIYYKIKHPDHNLIRTRAQAQLLKSMEQQSGGMETIIREIMKG